MLWHALAIAHMVHIYEYFWRTHWQQPPSSIPPNCYSFYSLARKYEKMNEHYDFPNTTGVPMTSPRHQKGHGTDLLRRIVWTPCWSSPPKAPKALRPILCLRLVGFVWIFSHTHNADFEYNGNIMCIYIDTHIT